MEKLYLWISWMTFLTLGQKGVSFMVCELKKETPLEISSTPKISFFTDGVQLAQPVKLAGRVINIYSGSFGFEFQPRLIPLVDRGGSAKTLDILCVWTCPLRSLSLVGHFSDLSFLPALLAVLSPSPLNQSITWLDSVGSHESFQMSQLGKFFQIRCLLMTNLSLNFLERPLGTTKFYFKNR